MSRESAANELIRARDNVRELQKAGKEVTRDDVKRVANADKAYTEASKK